MLSVNVHVCALEGDKYSHSYTSTACLQHMTIHDNISFRYTTELLIIFVG